MATANTKATAISNADSTPVVITNSRLTRAPLFEAVGIAEVAAADDNASVYRFARLRSSDRISALFIANDAITGGTAFDFGLYRTAADGGAAVDDDLFASALDLSSAGAFTDRLYEATAANIDKAEKQLWELLGLSEDPGIEYDLAATADTVGSGAGTIAVRVVYAG